MARKTLNLGIVAHVDAGKTTLTERLLYAAGVIDAVGTVDAGTTHTDYLELERRRGITIRSAVVSFALGDVTVNLIDTPGHPDFIAEVERVLSVLDGAVLVLSAVEGVQPQTRVLWRALQRIGIPALLFVNKIDRAGADDARVLDAIRARLTPAIVPLGAAHELGTRTARFVPWGEDDAAFRERLAEVAADRDETLLAALVENEAGVPFGRLREALAEQSRRALVHPVLFGSALTGAGLQPLTDAIAELLPAREGNPDGPAAGRIFKIERGPAGEKIAYVRMFSGTLRRRERVREDKVTAVAVFAGAAAVPRPSVAAGGIAKLWGLGAIRVGDRIGEVRPGGTEHHFDPPTLEALVLPRDPADGARLRVALDRLAEQDPLIDVRRDEMRGALSVSLYGEVQKEVLEATLADDFGVEVEFRESTTIHVERPARAGEAAEILNADGNPFPATVGLRVDPAPEGSEVEFRLEVDTRFLPLYAYKRREAFATAMAGYVRETLREGLHGWRVVDCAVTMTQCGYASADGPPSTRGSLSTPGDYQRLTPLVLMEALVRAGTTVCEPVLRARLELPADALGAVLRGLAQLGAAVEAPSPRGELTLLEAVLPAARLQELRRRLPSLTAGEGVLETEFAGYRPVAGEPPNRPRTTPNPLDRKRYLLHLARRA